MADTVLNSHQLAGSPGADKVLVSDGDNNTWADAPALGLTLDDAYENGEIVTLNASDGPIELDATTPADPTKFLIMDMDGTDLITFYTSGVGEMLTINTTSLSVGANGAWGDHSISNVQVIFNVLQADIDFLVRGDTIDPVLGVDAGNDTAYADRFHVGGAGDPGQYNCLIDGNITTVGNTINALIDLNLNDGDNDDVAIGAGKNFRTTSAGGAYTISGMTGGVDGREVTILNRTNAVLTIENENAGSAAANQIITNTGGDWATTGPGVANFVYDGTSNRWLMKSNRA
jgi:hypothetical protein